MGEAKRKQRQQEIDQSRGFRAHIAEQLATLYQKRAGILESRLNTEATIAKFRESIRPENALGSAKIEKLAGDMATSLECAQTCCDMAIEDLSDVWTDAAWQGSTYIPERDRIAPRLAGTPGRHVPPAVAAVEPEKPRSSLEIVGDVDPRDPHYTAPRPIDQVAEEWCRSCKARDVDGTGGGVCNLHPRPMPDGGCQNHDPDDQVGDPADTHHVPAGEGDAT